MARKQRIPIADPPAASSPEQEDEVENEAMVLEEEDVDASIEKEIAATPEKKKKKKKTTKKKKKEKDSKKNPQPSPTSGTKRPAASEVDPGKKKRKMPEVESQDDPKPLFQRIWEKEHEIQLLESIIQYEEENETKYSANTQEFYDFLMKTLELSVTKTQVLDKIKRLRGSYRTKAAKKKYRPTQPHEIKLFELCEKAFSEEVVAKTVVGISRPGALQHSRAEEVVWSERFEFLYGKGLKLLDESKRAELQAQLQAEQKKLLITQVEHYIEELELKTNHAMLFLEALKSGS